MTQTWIEYGYRFPDGHVLPFGITFRPDETAPDMIDVINFHPVEHVTRTVTATDWTSLG